MQQQSPALMSVTWPPTPNSVAASFDLVTDIANPSELQKQSSNHSKCNALNLTSFDVESYNEKAQMKFVPPPETERVEDYAYCLLCESGRGESDLSQHETLLCKHILCVTCVSAIIDAGTSSPASAAEALLSGFPCPFRCSEGRLGGVAEGRKCLKIKENFMRNVFACAFKKAKDESSKPTAFNRVTMERLFKSKFSLLMNDHVNQDLEKTSLWMTEGIDSVLRTRRFLNCRCGAIVIGGLQTCQDELESNSSLHDLKCNRCSDVRYCRKHKDSFILFKCQYCCSKEPATWVCGQDVQMCSKCHKHPGPKRNCLPANCVFGGEHPKDMPAGIRHRKYSLGCAACLI